MAILTCYAMKNELFREIVSTIRYSIDANGVRDRAMTMINSNKLISDPESSRLFYDCAIGVKTGSTAQGGKCLVAAATKNGATVVAVLLGVTEGGSKLDRMSTVYEDAKTIMELALTEQFFSVSPADLGLNPTLTVPLTGADAKEISLRVNLLGDPIILSRVSAQKIQSDPSIVQAVPSVSFVTAPVSEGDLCGTVEYSINGSVLFTGELVAAESIDTLSSELSVSTVATPVPEVTAPQQESWFTSLPGWLLYIVAALVLGAAGFLAFILIKRKRSKSRKRHSK
jgi:D-alanyl-D-alanine carboxypeptidase (penicillin-binding protein 5/6)